MCTLFNHMMPIVCIKKSSKQKFRKLMDKKRSHKSHAHYTNMNQSLLSAWSHAILDIIISFGILFYLTCHFSSKSFESLEHPTTYGSSFQFPVARIMPTVFGSNIFISSVKLKNVANNWNCITLRQYVLSLWVHEHSLKLFHQITRIR